METLFTNGVKKLRDEGIKPNPKAMFFNKHTVKSKILKTMESREFKNMQRRYNKRQNFEKVSSNPTQNNISQWMQNLIRDSISASLQINENVTHQRSEENVRRRFQTQPNPKAMVFNKHKVKSKIQKQWNFTHQQNLKIC